MDDNNTNTTNNLGVSRITDFSKLRNTNNNYQSSNLQTNSSSIYSVSQSNDNSNIPSVNQQSKRVNQQSKLIQGTVAQMPKNFSSAQSIYQNNIMFEEDNLYKYNQLGSNVGYNHNLGSKPLSEPLSMEQKVNIIKEAYRIVLGREATDKDISYYKYGIITEESMIKSLVRNREHKDVIAKGREFDKIKQLYDETLAKSRFYESKIKDYALELQKMQVIFDQKNKYINDLRSEISQLREQLENKEPLNTQLKFDNIRSEIAHTDRNTLEREQLNVKSKSFLQEVIDAFIDFIGSLFRF